MKTFTDNAGRPWTVAINVDAIKRVRSLLDVDLLEIVEGKLIERLIRDPVLLCDVVYAVCKLEADEKGVSDEEFGRAMAGDAIEHATKALLEDLVDFFQNRRDRENLRRVLGAMQQVMDRARDLIEQRIEAGELEKLVERALATVGSSSGAAPESPESSLAG
jgi:hypothetical protein